MDNINMLADKKYYVVAKGLFAGHVFVGEIINEGRRIFDTSTLGQSFFTQFCKEITQDEYNKQNNKNSN